jgi:quercetin dioxygenase-like cupin family protein
MPLLLSLLLAIQITNVTWVDAPPTMPKGTQIAVLEGDIKQPGIFTIRLKVPAGSKLPAHTHPRDERVTVLSGKVVVDIDGRKTTFTAGGFYVNPPNVPHSVYFPKASVIQLTCEGPWEMKRVEQ